MKQITFAQLEETFSKFNQEHRSEVTQFGKCHLMGAIVFKASNWPGKDYDLESRTYITQSDNKYFMPDMGGNSLYADCMDGSESGVRLDWYLSSWEVEYCYLIDD